VTVCEAEARIKDLEREWLCPEGHEALVHCVEELEARHEVDMRRVTEAEAEKDQLVGRAIERLTEAGARIKDLEREWLCPEGHEALVHCVEERGALLRAMAVDYNLMTSYDMEPYRERLMNLIGGTGVDGAPVPSPGKQQDSPVAVNDAPGGSRSPKGDGSGKLCPFTYATVRNSVGAAEFLMGRCRDDCALWVGGQCAMSHMARGTFGPR